MATAFAICLAAALAVLAPAITAGQRLTAAIVSCQIAAAAAISLRRARRQPEWPILAGALAFAACAAAPQATQAIGAAARLTIYATLFLLFARSLRSGQTPIATGLAGRIHPILTTRRIAYTRGVTWLWTIVFALQSALCLLILITPPGRIPARFAAWADLPLVAFVLAAELAVRAVRFRGQPHGSARDMLRAFRAGTF